ncbi:hypothetical protein ACQ86F_03445 [Streptomyces venezuelae ATCC 10712]
MAMNTPHDPVAEDDDLELLACGRDLASVWETAGRPDADPHTADCPYCRGPWRTWSDSVPPRSPRPPRRPPRSTRPLWSGV